MLSANNIGYLNNKTRVQESFGNERLHHNNKVLLIVLDGLRWDCKYWHVIAKKYFASNNLNRRVEESSDERTN